MDDVELRWTAGALSVLAALAAVSILLDVDSAVRAPIVLAALLLCPGWAFVIWIARAERPLMWAASGGLSCALSILLSLAMVRIDWWRPRAAVVALLAFSYVLLVSRLFRSDPELAHRGAA